MKDLLVIVLVVAVFVCNESHAAWKSGTFTDRMTGETTGAHAYSPNAVPEQALSGLYSGLESRVQYQCLLDGAENIFVRINGLLPIGTLKFRGTNFDTPYTKTRVKFDTGEVLNGALNAVGITRRVFF